MWFKTLNLPKFYVFETFKVKKRGADTQIKS